MEKTEIEQAPLMERDEPMEISGDPRAAATAPENLDHEEGAAEAPLKPLRSGGLFDDKREAIAEKAARRRLADMIETPPPDNEAARLMLGADILEAAQRAREEEAHEPGYDLDDLEREAMGKTARAAEPAKQSHAPATNAPVTGFLLRVNGSTETVDRTELVRRATMLGGDDLDHATLSDRQLIALAQVNTASLRNLDESKRTVDNARQSIQRRDTSDVDADIDADRPDIADKADQLSSRKLIDAIQYSDPEEAASVLDAYFDRRAEQREQKASQNQAISKTLNDADREFSELTNDPIAQRVLPDLIREVMVREFRQVGVSNEQMQGTMDNAMRLRLQLVAQGKLRPMRETIAEAVNSYRTMRGDQPAAPVQQQARPNSPIAVDRSERKAGLSRQPASAGSVPSSQQVQSMTMERKAAVAAIRAARGK